jgi:hypothetical protein
LNLQTMYGMAHYNCTTRFAVTTTLQLCLLLALVILEIGVANAKQEGSLFPTAAFLSKTRPVSVDKTKSWQVVHQQRWHATSKHQAENDSLSAGEVEDDVNAAAVVVGVVAPMKYIGPYPCLALRFPSLQKSLDFVVDTGANVNGVNTQIVKDLNLPVVLKAVDPPNNANGEGSGVTMKAAGAGGSLSAAGDIVLLGDCCLEGLPLDQKDMIFFSNLTAAAISSRPVLHGIVDGLLGDNMFLDAFPAGVEFDWHGTDGDPPTFIFYAGHDLPDVARPGLSTPPIPIERLPQSDLCSVSIQINDPNSNGTTTTNTNLTAILDTGSPVTILHPSAAKKAGIDTVPFILAILDQALPSQKQKQQTIGDEFLTVGGID